MKRIKVLAQKLAWQDPYLEDHSKQQPDPSFSPPPHPTPTPAIRAINRHFSALVKKHKMHLQIKLSVEWGKDFYALYISLQSSIHPTLVAALPAAMLFNANIAWLRELSLLSPGGSSYSAQVDICPSHLYLKKWRSSLWLQQFFWAQCRPGGVSGRFTDCQHVFTSDFMSSLSSGELFCKVENDFWHICMFSLGFILIWHLLPTSAIIATGLEHYPRGGRGEKKEDANIACLYIFYFFGVIWGISFKTGLLQKLMGKKIWRRVKSFLLVSKYKACEKRGGGNLSWVGGMKTSEDKVKSAKFIFSWQ